jgi:chemotaxis protein MotB
MALARIRRRQEPTNFWPAYVDALATLLLMIIFLLVVFVLGQFFIARDSAGRDDALQALNRRISELTDLLALERAGLRGKDETILSLSSTLDTSRGEAERLRLDLGRQGAEAQAAGGRLGQLGRELEAERQLSARAAAQVEILNQQIAAMRRQLAALEEALNASETRDKESQARIADLGSRLNVALAQRVQELARYRSDFFGRLRQVLANRPEIRIVGDRFVFQSEVFFDSGQAVLNAGGRPELDKLAATVLDMAREIPPDIGWVLRVDGHTDRRPIGSAQFPSNWHLSAARAIAVVQYLATRGVPAERLLAAGFGEFQPLDAGDNDEAWRRNRRIEMKLTER